MAELGSIVASSLNRIDRTQLTNLRFTLICML